jgi:hypothetical protein
MKRRRRPEFWREIGVRGRPRGRQGPLLLVTVLLLLVHGVTVVRSPSQQETTGKTSKAAEHGRQSSDSSRTDGQGPILQA